LKPCLKYSFTEQSGEVTRTTPFFSLLGSKVKVETEIGTVEGTFKHIDSIPSLNYIDLYPKRLILENEHGFIVVKSWQTVKKSQVKNSGIFSEKFNII
jgi:hypothetical protein